MGGIYCQMSLLVQLWQSYNAGCSPSSYRRALKKIDNESYIIGGVASHCTGKRAVMSTVQSDATARIYVDIYGIRRLLIVQEVITYGKPYNSVEAFCEFYTLWYANLNFMNLLISELTLFKAIGYSALSQHCSLFMANIKTLMLLDMVASLLLCFICYISGENMVTVFNHYLTIHGDWHKISYLMQHRFPAIDTSPTLTIPRASSSKCYPTASGINERTLCFWILTNDAQLFTWWILFNAHQ